MSSLFRHFARPIVMTAIPFFLASSASSAELSSETLDQLLAAGRWTPKADDTEQRERLPSAFVRQLVDSYPNDKRSIGLLSLALGAGKWGVDGDMSGLKDPTGDDWNGPTRASGKHLMSYRVGGVGLPHLDREPLAQFIAYLLSKHADIGPASEQAHMTGLARDLRSHKTYDQIKNDATFRKWMLTGLRERDAQAWILNFWLDTYWQPAYAASGGDVRLALVVARVWNTRPQLGRCAVERARKAENSIDVALKAYVECPHGKIAYKERRWAWMKRPVALFDAYFQKPRT